MDIVDRSQRSNSRYQTVIRCPAGEPAARRKHTCKRNEYAKINESERENPARKCRVGVDPVRMQLENMIELEFLQQFENHQPSPGTEMI